MNRDTNSFINQHVRAMALLVCFTGHFKRTDGLGAFQREETKALTCYRKLKWSGCRLNISQWQYISCNCNSYSPLFIKNLFTQSATFSVMNVDKVEETDVILVQSSSSRLWRHHDTKWTNQPACSVPLHPSCYHSRCRRSALWRN